MTELKEQLASSDMLVPCYLVAHPKGVLLWDARVIPDTAFKADGKPVSAPLLMATTTLEKPLFPRMAAPGRPVFATPPSGEVAGARTVLGLLEQPIHG